MRGSAHPIDKQAGQASAKPSVGWVWLYKSSGD